MTERWRKRLEHLDGASPSDDVFRRANQGPQVPDDPVPQPSTSTRVVTAIAALAIFALAISVFAIPALRLREQVRGTGDVLLPVWPVRTLDGAEQAQAYADGGELPTDVDLSMFKWSPNLFRADAVAHTFALHVLGWRDPTLVPLDSGTYVDPSGSSTPSTGPYPPPGPTQGPPACTPVTYPGSAGPSASMSIECPDGTTGPPSPFRRFTIYDGNSLSYFEPSVTVTMYQPLGTGEGNVWTVLDVRDERIDLGVVANERLRAGQRVAIRHSWDPDTLRAGIHVGASEGCDLEANIDALEMHTVEVTVPTAPLGSTCERYEPAYVYAYVAGDEPGGASADPIADGSSQRLLAMAAVPVVVRFPSDAVAPSDEEGIVEPEAPSQVQWTTYSDEAGWTVDLPDDWYVHLSAGPPQDDGTTTTGTTISSNDPSHPSPESGVSLTVTRPERGPTEAPRDSDPFPLRWEALARDPNRDGSGWAMGFAADGAGYGLTVDVVGDGLTPDAETSLRRIVESLRFDPWTVGETRGRWTAYLPLDDASVERDGSLEYESTYWREGIGYLIPMDPPCAGAGWDFSGSSGPHVVCEDGREGRWRWDGVPNPANLEGLTTPLDVSPAIVSWDRFLLVARG
jgi:hypothetical protein